jgi:hypothetical protein
MGLKEKITARIAVLNEQKGLMIEYLLMKVSIGDYHGVADAAMDLREIDAELKGLKLSLETILPEAP